MKKVNEQITLEELLENNFSISSSLSLKSEIEKPLLFIVLPKVARPCNIGSRYFNDDNPILLGYVDENNEFSSIPWDNKILGDPDLFRSGMRIEIHSEIKKDARDLTDPLKEEITVKVKSSRSPKFWRRGCTIENKKSVVDLCYGQNVLVTAPPEGGKSYKTRYILDKFNISNFSGNTEVFRVLFGERKDDDLGHGTVDTDSSAPIGVQMYNLYEVITRALLSSYEGKDVVLGIDSLTRMIEQLTTSHADTHMLSGGISSVVKNMVGRLFRMAGETGDGSLTIIGTSLWARSNGGWKNIYAELSSIATAEFFPLVRSGARDSSRRKPDDIKSEKRRMRIGNLIEFNFN